MLPRAGLPPPSSSCTCCSLCSCCSCRSLCSCCSLMISPRPGVARGDSPSTPSPSRLLPSTRGPASVVTTAAIRPTSVSATWPTCELKIFIPFAFCIIFDLQRRRTPGGTLRLWSVLRATDPDLIIARLFMSCAAEEGRQPGNQS